jgi:hypothetical protein
MLTMKDIAMRMIVNAINNKHQSERDYCRDANMTAQFLISVGKHSDADPILLKAWHIAQFGASSESEASKSNSSDGTASGTPAEEDIVTTNIQVRAWREIELVQTHLMKTILQQKKLVLTAASEGAAPLSEMQLASQAREQRKIDGQLAKISTQFLECKNELIETHILKLKELKDLSAKYETLLVEYIEAPEWKSMDQRAKDAILHRQTIGSDAFESNKQIQRNLDVIEADFAKKKAVANKALDVLARQELLYFVSLLPNNPPFKCHLHAELLSLPRFCVMDNNNITNSEEDLKMSRPLANLNMEQQCTVLSRYFYRYKSARRREYQATSARENLHLVFRCEQMLFPDVDTTREDTATRSARWQLRWETQANNLNLIRILREVKKLKGRIAHTQTLVDEGEETVQTNLTVTLYNTLTGPEEEEKRLLKLLGESHALVTANTSKVKYLQNKFSNWGQNVMTEDTCAVCWLECKFPVVTECGHIFCSKCLETTLKRTVSKCPTCWQKVDPLKIIAVQKEVPIDLTTTRAPIALLDDSSLVVPNSGGLADTKMIIRHSDVAQIKIEGEGEFGTKVEFVVKHLLMILGDDPTTKVLIFSQFSRLLELIAACLSRNKLNFLHLKGSSQQRATMVNSFKTGSANALLMSLKKDNSGLTLTCATHVLLTEPSLDPAIEAQAISRLHRLGQEKNVYCHKYIMKNSIESRITAINQRKSSQGGVSRQVREEINLDELLNLLELDANVDPDAMDML